MMQWDDLQYVLAVAETGSFSAAGRALSVHHATVLRRITAFEADCGVKVFERGVKGYHLTPESSHILSTVRNIEGMIERLNRTIAAQGEALNGPLRITTTDTLCSSLMVKYACEFNRQYPDIQLDLLSRNDQQDLSRREADIAIRISNSLSPDLTGTYAGELSHRAYAAARYLDKKGTADDITHHDWLGVSGMIQKASFSSWMDNHIPAHNIICRADSFVTLTTLAEAAYGIAILPCCLGDASNQLVRLDTLTPLFSRGLWVATHPELFHSVKIQLGISFFVDALNQDRARLTGNAVKHS